MSGTKALVGRAVAVAVFGLGYAGAAHAAVVSTATSQAAGNNWNTLPTIWSDGLIPAAGNTYVINSGGLVRNPDGSTGAGGTGLAGQTVQFLGDSLSINPGAQVRLKSVAAGMTINFGGSGGGLILNGGILNTGDDQIFTIAGGVKVTAPSILDFGSTVGTTVSNPRSIILTAPLSGSANLDLKTAGIVNPFDIKSANNPYSGTFHVYSGYLKGSAPGSLGTANFIIDDGTSPALTGGGGGLFETTYDLATPGFLAINGAGKMILHQNDTFSSVTIGGTALSAGTHPYAELLASFPNNFAPGGSGSITVGPVPEPGTAALLGIAALAALGKRRRAR